MLGDSLNLDTDFSSYTQVATIRGPPPAKNWWCTIFIDSNPPPKQYVALQKQALTGDSYLEVAELEVYGF